MGCSGCRFTTKETRPKVLDVSADAGDMEMIEVDETVMEEVYSCQHPTQAGRFIGIGATAGEGCTLFEAGAKRGIDPELEKRLRRFEEG